MSDVGKRLKQARINSKLKQVDVTKKTGINNKTLSGYENGLSNPDYDTLITLSKLYNVSIDELLTGEIVQERNWKLDNVLDSYIRHELAILLDDRDNPYYSQIENAVNEGIQGLLSKHEITLEGNSIVLVDEGGIRYDVVEQFADYILSVKNDAFHMDVLDLLRAIAHDFHIEYSEFIQVGLKDPVEKKLETLLMYPNLTFNNHKLEPSDKTKILEMLRIMFN